MCGRSSKGARPGACETGEFWCGQYSAHGSGANALHSRKLLGLRTHAKNEEQQSLGVHVAMTTQLVVQTPCLTPPARLAVAPRGRCHPQRNGTVGQFRHRGVARAAGLDL